MAEVDYYFTMLSPWAYIGHDAFHDAMERTGTTVSYLPINLPQAFKATETQMLGNRHKTRQDYRTLELQRWAVKRGLTFNFWPAYWPFQAVTADRMMIAAISAGENPAPFMREIFTGIWERETNYAEENALVAAADAVGMDGIGLLERSRGDDSAATHAANTTAAIDRGVFGVPAYFYDGEYFWGQDRVELLEDALVAGRSGYKTVYPDAKQNC